MRRRAVGENNLDLQMLAQTPQDLQPLPHAIGGITHDPIQPATLPAPDPTKTAPQRRVRKITNKAIEISIERAILHEIRNDIAVRLPPDTAAVDITPQNRGAEMRTRDRKTARSHEGVIYELSRGRESHIRRDEREFGIHGRRADVRPFLEVVGGNHVSAACAD